MAGGGLTAGIGAYFWDVANDLPLDMTRPRAERLSQLIPSLRALLEGETSGGANLANAAAAVHSASGWHWVGFYLVDFEQDNLVLGPFQGPVACTRLFRGKGVCAAAWEQKRTQVVPDVHAFPGHVACSSASLSEVVLPVRNSHGEVVAVWDIDSAEADDFAPDDVAALEGLTSVISSMWDSWTWAG